MPEPTERERLITHICEFVRLTGVDVADYFRIRQRLQKTRIETLRQILEDDQVEVTAKGWKLLRTATVRSAITARLNRASLAKAVSL